MSVKAKVEAIIYATEEPVTLDQLAALLKDQVLAELRAQDEEHMLVEETSFDGPPVDVRDEGEKLEELAESGTSGPPLNAADTPAEVRQPEPESPAAAEKRVMKEVKARLASLLEELVADYNSEDHGMEIREIAGGYRITTKPEHHDVVVGFARSLKPQPRLSMPALETLAVIAYKQPVTVPEIGDIRGVDSAGVIATLLDRKLITTAGRKQVVGRPILYKTSKEFLLRFGLKDVDDLPSMEEFAKLGDPQSELFPATEAAPSAESESAEAKPESSEPAEPAPDETTAL